MYGRLVANVRPATSAYEVPHTSALITSVTYPV